jgi:hypothetical protein
VFHNGSVQQHRQWETLQRLRGMGSTRSLAYRKKRVGMAAVKQGIVLRAFEGSVMTAGSFVSPLQTDCLV